MLRSKRFVVATVVACVLGGIAATARAATPTLLVDDDHQQCPSATFTSINMAIVAAPAGAIIKVCAGVYNERINVIKPVTLYGARNGNAAAPGRDNLSQESVVVNDGTGGFDVVASSVVIDGFTVLGNPGAPQYPNAGIYLRTGTQREISDNVLRSNGLGIYVESDQSALTV